MNLPVDFLRHKLSVEDFHRMGAAGILREDSRIELIDGELIDMPSIGSLHASVVNRLAVLVARALEPALVGISIQNPLTLLPDSEPVPDLMLLRRREDEYASALPGAADVLLLVEVADSSLRYDRTIKLDLYARHGVPEVWLVDVHARCLEVYREPSRSGYGLRLLPGFDEAVSPVGVPKFELVAQALFP